jgi:hypothetical protein
MNISESKFLTSLGKPCFLADDELINIVGKMSYDYFEECMKLTDIDPDGLHWIQSFSAYEGVDEEAIDNVGFRGSFASLKQYSMICVLPIDNCLVYFILRSENTPPFRAWMNRVL